MSLEDLSLEQRDELALLAKEMSDNPATRKEMLRLTKKLRPNMNIPELEVEDFTEKRTAKAEERVEQLEAKLRERDALEELNKRRDRLIKKGLIQNESEIDEVEKIMLEKKISDHETAAEYFQWMKQAAEPTPSGYNPSPLKGFNLKEYWKNPTMGARNEAAAALKDIRNLGRKAIGV
jgi:hypothetical protein